MASLPPSSEFNGSTVTEGQQKTFINNLRDFLAGLLGTDGTIATALQTLKAIFATISAKSAAYTVVSTDQGKVINATGTWTLSLTAAATLGAGFCFAVKNSGSGTITIDPSATETIDGGSTISVDPGVGCVIVSDGTSWYSVGKSIPISYPISVANGGTGATGAATALTNLGAASASHTHSYVPTDCGYNTIGSLCFAEPTTSVTLDPGATISGSSLRASNGSSQKYPTVMSGTWRILGYNESGTMTSVYQRIA